MAEGIDTSAGIEPRFEYVAEYDERGVKEADRSYYLRSLVTIRALTTIGTPALCLLIMLLLQLLPLALQRLGVPVAGLDLSGYLNGATAVFGALAALSILTNLFFFLMRPIGNWAAIRKSPRRVVQADQSGITINTGARAGHLEWQRIEHVWQTERYLMLVIGKILQISLPKKGMPEGMEDFIKRSVKKS